MALFVRDAYLPSIAARGEGAEGAAAPAGRARANILVRGERVAAIGGPELEPPPGVRVVEAAGCVALPGLVNCHNHVAMTLLRGHGADLPLQRWLEERIWPAEARLSDDDVRAGAMLGCLEMLRGGTTAFADMYDHMDAVADAVEASGIRGVLARGVIGLRPTWEAALQEGADLCRRVRASPSGRLSAMIAPHAEYTCPIRVWEEAIALAQAEGVPLHTHVAETRAEVAGCRRRHHCSPVQFLLEVGALEAGCLLAHCVHVDAEDIRLLAGPRLAVAHNPVSNAKLGSGVAPLARLLAAGVRVGLGTDGAASTDFLGLWEEMRLAAWLQKASLQDAAALPAREVLALATLGGALALRLPPGCGTIAVGAPADLILVSSGELHQQPRPDALSGVLYGTREADVVLTLVAGRVVMEGGEFPGIDHERVASDAAERSRRLLAEA